MNTGQSRIMCPASAWQDFGKIWQNPALVSNESMQPLILDLAQVLVASR